MSARPSMTSRLEFLLRTLSMHLARYAGSFIKDRSARISSKWPIGFKLDFLLGHSNRVFCYSYINRLNVEVKLGSEPSSCRKRVSEF